MSSSSKKKLRQEQEAAAQTQKQHAAKKESDKVRLLTIIFFAVILFMIVVVVIASVERTGVFDRNSTAMKVGDQSISAAETNVYFTESVGSFLNQFGQNLGMFGLNPSKPLDSQMVGDSGSSWADNFLEDAKKTMHQDYAVYLEAKANGYELSQDGIDSVNNTIKHLSEAAVSAGVKNASKYLTMLYGTGVTEDVYRQFLTAKATAQEYAQKYDDELKYSPEQIAAKDAEDPAAYDGFTYNTYVMNVDTYLPEGTKGEDGKVTYTDEQKAEALAKCKADAEALASVKTTTVEKFDAAIAELAVNKDKSAQIKSSLSDNIRISGAPDFMKEWLTDSSRKTGDIVALERTAENEDGEKVVNGYNVVVFGEHSDNLFALKNVRHILVAFKNGVEDPNTGSVTYTEAAKAAAKEAAQAILDEWTKGEATEDSFAALSKEKNEDPGSKENGGLYTDIYPGQMVPTFEDWCYDEGRKVGDTGLVETEYGYHVMYFTGDSEGTFRNFLISRDMKEADFGTWFDGLLEKYPIAAKSTSRVNKDLVISTSMFAR